MATLLTQQLSNSWSGGRLARLNQQTGLLLRDVLTTTGVRGACVFDNRGNLLAAKSNEDWDAGMLRQLGLDIARWLATLERNIDKSREIELRFMRGGLLVRDLGSAFELVLCAPIVNWSLLRMTVNVAAAAFEKDTELQKALGVVAPSRQDLV